MRRSVEPVLCSRCQAAVSGGPADGLTPAAMLARVVEPVRVRDSRLVAAETKRDEARLVFDAVDEVYLARLQVSQHAQIHGGGDLGSRRVLEDEVAALSERRVAAWNVVVAGNERVRIVGLQLDREAAVAA